MSFLVDPPLLVGTGAVIETTVPDRRKARALEIGTLALFLGTSISLYLECPWTTWLWKLCRAKSGRDWMLNSGVFKFDYEHPSKRTHLFSALAFCTYPFWLHLGRKLGGRIAQRAGGALES
jgi:hypothetical protein